MDIRDLNLVRAILQVPTSLTHVNHVCDLIADRFEVRLTTCLSLRADRSGVAIPFCNAVQRAVVSDPAYVADLAGISEELSRIVTHAFRQPDALFHDPLAHLPPDLCAVLHRNGLLIEKWFGVYHQVGASFGANEKFPSVLGITLERDRDRASFLSQPGLNQVARLLADAYQLHAYFADLQERYRQVLGVLDMLRIGIVLVDRSRNVLAANVRAHEILEHIPRIRIRHGCLEIPAAIEKGLRARFNEPEIVGPEAEPACFVTGDDHRSDRFAILLRSVHLTKATFDDQLDTVTLVLVDTADTRISSLSVTAKALALTPSETATLRCLLDGMTYREVADARSVSPETTKSHVASILAKSGCRRVPELVLKVARLDTPLEPEQNRHSSPERGTTDSY